MLRSCGTAHAENYLIRRLSQQSPLPGVSTPQHYRYLCYWARQPQTSPPPNLRERRKETMSRRIGLAASPSRLLETHVFCHRFLSATTVGNKCPSLLISSSTSEMLRGDSPQYTSFQRSTMPEEYSWSHVRRNYCTTIIALDIEEGGVTHPTTETSSASEVPPPAATAPPFAKATSPVKEYSTPELTRDAALHKKGLSDPDVPFWQNPLYHEKWKHEEPKVFREDFASEEEFEAAVLPAPPLDLGDGRPPVPAYLDSLADEIVHMTVLEMNELVNKIGEHYGFHEELYQMSMEHQQQQYQSSGAAGAGEAASEPVVEKTTFDVKLVAYDEKSKIKIIKEVRAIAGLGLKEAKDFVEGIPKVIQKGIKKEQADEIKAKLEEVGATVEID